MGKPVAADFRDSAEHFVSVLREHGIGLSFGRDELRYVDDLAERLAKHNEYRDSLGSWIGGVLVRTFAGEWVLGHAICPAVWVITTDRGRQHLFPLALARRALDSGL